jgi:hypothetical protein
VSTSSVGIVAVNLCLSMLLKIIRKKNEWRSDIPVNTLATEKNLLVCEKSCP